MKLTSIHPFAARMAPKIVFRELAGVASGQRILDPMAGSGTVLRAATELGHEATGFDMDPLAVLMSRVWTTSITPSQLITAAARLIEKASHVRDEYLPWIDDDEETKEYIDFWFRAKQRNKLRRISFCLAGRSGPIADALRIALSRIIITKERGASVARDTSHSRPHRVFFENDYDVFEGFARSVSTLASRLAPEKLIGQVSVQRGDARHLSRVAPASVDVVITSPPYLNAIDYMRGHRLALVWLGYSLSKTRNVRSCSIGVERCAANPMPSPALDKLLANAGPLELLPARERGMVERYAQDLYLFMKELSRIVKSGGRVLLVVGDSCLKKVQISNAAINIAAAKLAGFEAISRRERQLQPSLRYLPLSATTVGSLSHRMKTESLLSFSI
jgi:adenine-specific DNA methylase